MNACSAIVAVVAIIATMVCILVTQNIHSTTQAVEACAGAGKTFSATSTQWDCK